MTEPQRDPLAGLASLVDDVPGLTASARERVVRSALMATEHAPARAVPPLDTPNVPRVARWLFPAVAGFAAAAAVVLLVVTPSAEERAGGSNVAVELQPQQEIPVGPARATLRSVGERAAVVSVREVERGGIMLSGIMLSEGRVELHAGGGDHRYRIETPTFQVESGEASLEVDTSSVRVRRGAVSIFAAGGQVIELGAGQSWSVSDLEPAPASSRTSASTAGAELPAADEPNTDEAAAEDAPAAARREPTVSAATWVARGRKALADGDVDRARTAVARALASRPDVRLRAEAETLRADAAMVSGDRERALELYLAVADRYRDRSAGENALFAAARLAARTSPDTAVSLFEKYAQRYPMGRFADEASAWIDRLR